MSKTVSMFTKEDTLNAILQLGLTQYYKILEESLNDGKIGNYIFADEVISARKIVEEISLYKFKEDQNETI